MFALSACCVLAFFRGCQVQAGDPPSAAAPGCLRVCLGEPQGGLSLRGKDLTSTVSPFFLVVCVFMEETLSSKPQIFDLLFYRVDMG